MLILEPIDNLSDESTSPKTTDTALNPSQRTVPLIHASHEWKTSPSCEVLPSFSAFPILQDPGVTEYQIDEAADHVELSEEPFFRELDGVRLSSATDTDKSQPVTLSKTDKAVSGVSKLSQPSSYPRQTWIQSSTGRVQCRVRRCLPLYPAVHKPDLALSLPRKKGTSGLCVETTIFLALTTLLRTRRDLTAKYTDVQERRPHCMVRGLEINLLSNTVEAFAADLLPSGAAIQRPAERVHIARRPHRGLVLRDQPQAVCT